MGLCLLMGALYVIQAQPMYRVGARVLVQQQGAPLDRTRASDRDKDFLATQAEIIRSPAVIERAVQRADLRPANNTLVDPVALVMASLKVTPLLGTNVLSLSFRGADPDHGVRGLQAVIASYRQYVREVEHDSHLKALRLLTRNEKELRGDLTALENQYQKLRHDSPLMGQGKDAASVQRALLTQLGQTLAQTKHRRIELENQLEVISRPAFQTAAVSEMPNVIAVRASTVGDTSSASARRVATSSARAQVTADPTPALLTTSLFSHDANRTRDLSTIQQELVRCQVRQRELAQIYGDKHPDMLAVQEQIKAWKAMQQEMIESLPRALREELASVQLQETRLAEMYGEEFDKVKVVDSYLLKEQQALEGIQRTQTIHESILSQLKQWQLADQALADGRAGVNVSVLEVPALAEREDWPPPLLLLGFCGVVGAIGGVGMITLAERMDSRIRSADEVQEELELAVLGRIPPLTSTRKGQERSGYYRHVVRQLEDSPVAEAFRGLRTRLQRSLRSKNGRIVLIVSPREGEGKTTVAANLAFSLAQLGKKVIVVDADLRSGVLHDIFDVASSTGLTAVLAQGLPLEDHIQHSLLGGVDVLARGPEVDNPAELLARHEFEKLLEALRQHYDAVVIDTPPLLLVTDASVLAPLADGILLSLAIGKSSLAEGVHACELLENLGVKPMGVVVNEVPMGRPGTYGYRRTPVSSKSPAAGLDEVVHELRAKN